MSNDKAQALIDLCAEREPVKRQAGNIIAADHYRRVLETVSRLRLPATCDANVQRNAMDLVEDCRRVADQKRVRGYPEAAKHYGEVVEVVGGLLAELVPARRAEPEPRRTGGRAAAGGTRDAEAAE